MAYELKNVVPWGRSFDEYISMFSLAQNELNKSILGCSDGPASFNSTMNQLGNRGVYLLTQFTNLQKKKSSPGLTTALMK